MLGENLDYCAIEWIALETNKDHSVIFEIALKNCILDSFVYYYFISVWDECNCVVVWAFFGIAFLWDWNEN